MISSLSNIRNAAKIKHLLSKDFATAIGLGTVVQQPRGYKRPTRRVMKSPERFPNVRTRAREYQVCEEDVVISRDRLELLQMEQ